MGDLRALVRLGLEDLLGEIDVELLAAPGPAALLDRLLVTLPDVVVLDLDQEHTPELADRIATDYPAVRVVACSADLPRMRVYPPFHRGECYECPLEPDQLAAAFGT
ncbi:MAG TPA: hypothetical protein VFP72_20455 [Kineosporiaceae bacterium]|nr:hypothetical protein [Kineosporiaceae bacterium]